MSRGERLSVLGLYHWDDDLFSEMVYPDNFPTESKTIFVGNVLMECAELECIFPDWNFMHEAIGMWSKMNKPTWDRIYKASVLVYNPIENYNRTEIETIDSDKTESHSGSDVTRASGTDTDTTSATNTHETLQGNLAEAHSGTDTTLNKNTAYDSGTMYDHDQSGLTHGETITTTDTRQIRDTTAGTVGTTYGKTDTVTYGKEIENSDSITRENHTTGNIGVTTSQQMLEQEINIAAALNVIEIMVQSFRNRFCILVY